MAPMWQVDGLLKHLCACFLENQGVRNRQLVQNWFRQSTSNIVHADSKLMAYLLVFRVIFLIETVLFMVCGKFPFESAIVCHVKLFFENDVIDYVTRDVIDT